MAGPGGPEVGPPGTGGEGILFNEALDSEAPNQSVELDSSGDLSHNDCFLENEQEVLGPQADNSDTSSGVDPGEDLQGEGSGHGAVGAGLEGVVHVMGPVAPAVDYDSGDDCAGMSSTSMQGLVHFERNNLPQMREDMLRFHDANPCWYPKVHQKAFDALKAVLCFAPVLAFPKFDRPWVLLPDASYSEHASIRAWR